MHFNEFKTQVEAQGVKLPAGWGGRGGSPGVYIKFAGLDHPGTGIRRNFTNQDVRLAVAWAKVHALTGVTSKSETSELSRRATQMLALYTRGWIIMSEGQVWWTREPTERVFDKGAICIPALP